VHPAADFCRLCGADIVPATRSAARSAWLDALREAPARLRAWRPRMVAPALPSLSSLASLSRPWVSSLRGVTRSLAAPRVRQRAAVAGVAILVVALAAMLGRASASGDGSAGGALAAAQRAVTERDAKIASLEGTIATGAKAQSALQTSVQSAQQESVTMRDARDSAAQQVTALEAKVRETEASLKDAQALTSKQRQDLRILSTCLNGTAVALAFGRTGRWPSADVALAAVADACAASTPLLQR